MSSPGMPINPLTTMSGVQTPENSTLRDLQLRQQLAQGLISSAGDGSPVASPWAALNRAVSPLLGALTMRDVNKQYGALQSGENTELGALASGTGDPIAAIAASHNPLIQAMLPDLVRAKLEERMKPQALQWHPATENAYDASGHLVTAGTPESKVQIAGGTFTTDGGKTWHNIPGYVEQAGATADARAVAAAAHRAPKAPPADKNNPLGVLPPWQIHGGS